MKNRLECMQPIRFLVVLLMCCLSYTTWAQTQSNVNGLVTDFSGEPLIGVSILVKGTSNGTVTDLDGMGHRTKRILRIERKEYQTY